MAIYGVGVNDITTPVQIFKWDGKSNQRVWYCPIYDRWVGMLARCYSTKVVKKRKSYEGVECAEEWKIFSSFKQWMEQHEWEGKELDKDIILPDSKFYSPDTCAFVWPLTNTFIIDRRNDRGNLPLGVTLSAKGKYVARCGNPFSKEREYLGLFLYPTEAHEAWRKRKHELAQLIAATETDIRVVEALKKRYSYEEWYKEGNTLRS